MAVHLGGVSGQLSVAIAILFTRPFSQALSEQPQILQLLRTRPLSKCSHARQMASTAAISSVDRCGEPAAFQRSTALT